MSRISMNGKPYPTCTFESDLLTGVTSPLHPRHLSAESLLVLFPQFQVIMIKYITTQVITHPCGSDIPAPIDWKKKITCERHYGKLNHQMKKNFI